MNYNYISCIDSRRKPDIYIGGKINLPAKNYRFTDITKKEANIKNEENNKNSINEINDSDKNKALDELSNKVTGSIKKSKAYLNEENEHSNKIIDLSKLEEIEDKYTSENNIIGELREKGKSFDSDDDEDGILIFLIST